MKEFEDNTSDYLTLALRDHTVRGDLKGRNHKENA
jgi:hypothetical protein